MVRHKRTKKTVGTFALLLMLGISLLLALPSSALAWDNCPKGWVNDPYPGACRRYVDTNGDGICDLSQSEPVAVTSTSTTTATTSTTEQSLTPTTVAVATSTAGEPPTGDCPLGPCLGCGACFSFNLDTAVVETTTVDSSVASSGNADSADSGSVVDGAASTAALAAFAASVSTSTTTPTSGGSGGSGVAAAAASTESSLLTPYLVSPIAIGFFLIYAVSFALYRTKRIRVATHRKIWNLLLLATFLITGVLGLLLTIQLDYTLPFTIPFNMLFWHVEAGIVMTLISFFHMAWHFNYYRKLFRVGRAKARAAREAEHAGKPGRVRVGPRPQPVLEAREQRRQEREARRLEQERARAAREMGPTATPRLDLRVARPAERRPAVPPHRHWAEPEME